MRMQNTEMEFVTFDAQDVIATSTITITGYWNGTSNDLTVSFKGKDYTDASSLYDALVASGYKINIAYKDANEDRQEDVLSDIAAFSQDKSDTDPSSIYSTGNGDYTWDGISHWIHSNLQ